MERIFNIIPGPQEDTCCILSRMFDPNDMFDTVCVSIWGEEKKPIQVLAGRFQELGYGSWRALE